MEFEDIQDMTIQELINFYEEITEEGGASMDPSDERAVAIKQEALSRAYPGTQSNWSDTEVLEKLKTML